MKALGGVIAALMVVAGPVAAQDWKPLDADNTLVVETTKGQVLIALQPDMAPQAVERIKTLTRRGFYDGLLFHRVVDHFVAQTGNPNNKDGGKSDLPNLPLESIFKLTDVVPHTMVARPQGASVGFIGATPYVAMNDRHMPPGSVRAWGTHCRGVIGMGRDDMPKDSANSELYIMRDTVPRLDRDYTVVGRVIDGFDILGALAIGEPPAQPDAMKRVRVLADVPVTDRPKVEIMDVGGPAFAALVAAKRVEKGADFSACDIAVPFRQVP